jgi:hypothetical protein
MTSLTEACSGTLSGRKRVASRHSDSYHEQKIRQVRSLSLP